MRTVPLPGFLAEALRRHRDALGREVDPHELVSTDRVGHPLRRSHFRRRVWRPSLVRAGLLGEVVEVDTRLFRASWLDAEGAKQSVEFATERDAVAQVTANATGGLRFHDLRHAYATWLVSDGVPINIVQRVMGHEQASTTLNRYTHTPDDYAARVLNVFDGPAASLLPPVEEAGPAEPDDLGEDAS